MCIGWACMPVKPGSHSLSSPQSEHIEIQQRAIIGGTLDTRYPAIGSLQAVKRSFCTGTLIASRLVVTAAHCIDAAKRRRSQGIKIEFRIDFPNATGYTPRYYEVDTMQNHPGYTGVQSNIGDDIGILTFKKDITGVTPMPIHTGTMDNSWINRTITFLGYGVIQTQPSRVSPNKKYSIEITLRRVTSDRFVTQDPQKSICSGDSGGPALYKVGGRLVQIGVNSYVSGSSTPAGPLCNGSGTSFRIDHYLSWLRPLINQYGGKCKTNQDCGPCFTCNTATGKCLPKGSQKASTFCAPCTSPQSCGGNGAICVRRSEGNRCFQACDNNGCCPLGTSCKDIGSGQKQCVPDKGVCPDVVCKADTDCGPGEECTSGVCRPKPVQPTASLCKKCQKDSDCNAGSKCHAYPDGSYCTQPCVADNFCPKGYSCTSIQNSYQCVSDKGECSCKATADCHTGYTCTSSLCQKPGGGVYGDACTTQRKCAKGYSCLSSSNGTQKTCFKPCKGAFPPGSHGSPCRGNRCNNGARCLGVSGIGNICLQLCSNNASCRYGGQCLQQGGAKLCICRTDQDCKQGHFCNKSQLRTSGTCSPKNTKPTTCPTGFECGYTGGSAELCIPKPSQNAGDTCGGVLRCKAGLVCANASTGRICIRLCSSANSCTGGGRCSRFGSTNICNCNNGNPCKKGFICRNVSQGFSTCTPGTCTQNSECGRNRICEKDVCKDKPECTKDADCGPGKVCRNKTCVVRPPEPKEEPVVQEEPAVKEEPAVQEEPTVPTESTTHTESVVPTEPVEQKEASSTEKSERESNVSETTLHREQNPQDGGTTELQKPLPPKGCGGCSMASTQHPDISFWLGLLFVLPWLRRRKRQSVSEVSGI